MEAWAVSSPSSCFLTITKAAAFPAGGLPVSLLYARGVLSSSPEPLPGCWKWEEQGCQRQLVQGVLGGPSPSPACSYLQQKEAGSLPSQHESN